MRRNTNVMRGVSSASAVGFKVRLACALGIALVCAPALDARAAGAEGSYAEARKAFQDAYAHASAPEDARSDGENLKSYPLYSYLQAERIVRELSRASMLPEQTDRRAVQFLAAHEEQPVARRLRSAWLESLAERTQWTPFLEAYRDSGASDALRCQSYAARIALAKTEGLAGELVREWLKPRSASPQCEGPFAWLRSNGVVTEDLIERRARYALESSEPALASESIAQLPAARAGPLAQWVLLLEHPAPEIQRLIRTPVSPVEAAALQAGWARLARTDSAAAKAVYEDFIDARQLDAGAASPYALALALALARRHDPQALKFFGRVSARDLTDAALEWRARSALWSKDWSEVTKSIAAMSPVSQQSPRWRYWSARAGEQLQMNESRKIYRSLLAGDDYYAALAAERLDSPLAPHAQKIPIDPETIATLEGLPALERAHELFLCGMASDASAEWRFAQQSLSRDERLQSITLAASWGWYYQAAATATAERVFNDYALLYPRPYDPEVSSAALRSELDPAMVYAVVRQESLYRVRAVSPAGALGLMQLMPETARVTAQYWDLPQPRRTDLFQPGINISLGAAHLRMLLDRFDDQIPVALAGYNAGATAATRWLPAEPLESDIWIENIPYTETRDYVQRILWNHLLFTWLSGAEGLLRSNAWLALIGPSSHSGASLRLADRGRRAGAGHRR
jgi:soluble lytic murein transglycosylase